MEGASRERAIVTSVDSQISAELSGEAVILNLNDGQYYGLTEVGAVVWEWLGQPIRVGEIIDRLTAMYEVEREECRADVLELIDELLARGLVSQRVDAD